MRLFTTIIFSLCLSSSYYAQCPAGEVEVELEIHTDNYAYEGYWELISVDSVCGQGTLLSGGNSLVGCSGAGNQNQAPGGYSNNQTYTSNAVCLIEGNTYRIVYVDDWGDGGFEFNVFVNGYLIDDFEGQGSFHQFDFNAAEPAAYNLSMLHAHVRPYHQPGDIEIEAEVFNGGAQTITSLMMHYSIDNGTPISQQLSGLNIPNATSSHISHPVLWSVSTDGTYDVKIWYTDLNGSNPDSDPSDDEIETQVTIGPDIVNLIDSYLIGLPVVHEVANGTDLVNRPTDLDFHPILTDMELWVLNKDSENTGSSTVTISNAGKPSQSELWRRDGNAWHFMSLSTGIAFSENTNFGTSPGVFDANHNSGLPFTGPALWSSDPAIYAQPSGGNGSHLDMLHESPKCQGIAHEVDNVFWVFDGYNNDIVRYNFNDDHGPGNDDHDDGEILRFSDLSVSKDNEEKVVSHLVYDKDSDWLYVVDNDNQRVFKMDTKSGELGGTPSFGPFETLAQYQHVTGYTWEIVIDSGLIEPAGIDIIGNYLLVSDFATGEIVIYDRSQTPATELKRLNTEAEGIQGIKVGPEGKIWYVDFEANTVNRIDWVPDSTVGVDNIPSALSIKLFPNPTLHQVFISNPYKGQVNWAIYNLIGSMVTEGMVESGLNPISLELPAGTYIVKFNGHKGQVINSERLIVQ